MKCQSVVLEFRLSSSAVSADVFTQCFVIVGGDANNAVWSKNGKRKRRAGGGMTFIAAIV